MSGFHSNISKKIKHECYSGVFKDITEISEFACVLP